MARGGALCCAFSVAAAAVTASCRDHRSSAACKCSELGTWPGKACGCAAQFFDGCLPEAFGGYPRQMTKYPVQYPTACSPQARSTRGTAPTAPRHPRHGARGGQPRSRSGAASQCGLAGAPRHPGTMGPDRRVRTRLRRHLTPVFLPGIASASIQHPLRGPKTRPPRRRSSASFVSVPVLSMSIRPALGANPRRGASAVAPGGPVQDGEQAAAHDPDLTAWRRDGGACARTGGGR